MDREILFRGKREENNEWVEGDLTKRKYEGGKDDGKVFEAHIVLDAYEQGNILNFGYRGGLVSEVGYECFRVDPKTVCQYTGLTDKNGRKIFEGDICKTHYANAKRNEFIETIVFNGGRFCAYQDKDSCKSWAGIYDGVPHLSVDKSVYMDEIEVIGNIFDNPDLLEGEKE